MSSPVRLGSVRYPRSTVFAPGRLALFTATVRLYGAHERHSHDFVETVLVRSGSGRHVSDAGAHRVAAGSVIVVRPGSWHGYAGCDDFVVTNCCFGPELFARELAWLRGERAVNRLLWSAPAAAGRAGVFVGRLKPQAVPPCEEALERLAATLQAAGPTQKVRALSWLMVLLAGLSEASTPARVQELEQAVPPAVVEAARLLDADPARQWAVSEVASEVAVGAAHLTRLFTAHLGTPPMAYLSRVRAERAAALLSESDELVSRIGAAVGWPDPNYFARIFRAHYGMSPREYRARRSPAAVAPDHS